MKRKALIPMLVCTTLAAAELPAVAQQHVTDAHVQELIKAAASRVGAQANGAPAIDTQAATNARPGIQLSLDDAVKLALDRNLDIAVQRLNPATFDYAISSLAAAYKPALTSQLSHVANTNPSTQTLSGAAVGTGIDQGTSNYNAGIAQNFKWGGGALAVQLNNNRQTTTSSTALFNPAFNTNWSAQFTQPLLRNFRIDTTRQQLAISRLNQ